jgi:hypothetical protein
MVINWMCKEGRIGTDLFLQRPSDLHQASTPNQDEEHILHVQGLQSHLKKAGKQLTFDDQIVEGLIVFMGKQDIVTDTCREDPAFCQPKTRSKSSIIVTKGFEARTRYSHIR